MSDERGMIAFWVTEEELKTFVRAHDHQFAFGWGSKQEEHARAIGLKLLI